MSKFYVTLLGTLLLSSVVATEAWADKKKNEEKSAERKPERKAPETRRQEPRPAEQRQPERRPVEQKRVEQPRVEQKRVEQPRVEQKRVEQPRPAPAPTPAPTPRQERERPERQERRQFAAPPAAKPVEKPQAQPRIQSVTPPTMSNDSQRKIEQPNRNEQPTRQLPAPRAAIKPNEDRAKPTQNNGNLFGFSAGSNSRQERDRDKDKKDNEHKRVLPKPGPVNANGVTTGSQPAIAGTQPAASLKPKVELPKAEPPKHHPKPRPIAQPDRDHDHEPGKPVVSTGIATGLAAGAAPGTARPNGRPDANDRRPGDQGHDHRPGDRDNDRNKPNYAAASGHQGHAIGPISRPYRTKPVIIHHDHHDDHLHRDRVVYVDRHHHHYRGSRWIFFGSTGYCRPNYYGAAYGNGFNDPYSVTVINPQPVTIYSPTYVADQEPVAVSTPTPTPQPPLRAVPAADAFNELPPQEQQKLILTALNDLEGDLKQSDTGDEWVDHLQLASIGKILTERDEPLDDSARLRLQAIADIFEEVAQEEEFKSVSQLWGFNVLNVGLHVMATDPVVCQRHRVSSAATALSQAFKTWQSSDRWQTYLRLETLATMDDAPEDLLVRIQEVDVITTKFDRIQAEAQYSMIHELPAFRATHVALRAYLNDLRSIAAEL